MAKTKKPEWKKIEPVPATPENMAETFKYFVKKLDETANSYVLRQDELIPKYDSYRLSLQNMAKLAKLYLDIDLPDLPGLPGNDYHAGILKYADWCKKNQKVMDEAALSKSKDAERRTAINYVSEIHSKIFKAKNIQDSIIILKEILPDLLDVFKQEEYQLIDSDIEVIELSIGDQLVELRAKSDIDIPPIPSPFSLLGCKDWITTYEKAMKEHMCWFDETTKRVVWDDDDPNFITVKDAADKSGGLFTVKSLGKHLRRKNNDIRWMNLGRRTKVHKQDFDSYLKAMRRIEQTRERISSKKGKNKANINKY